MNKKVSEHHHQKQSDLSILFMNNDAFTANCAGISLMIGELFIIKDNGSVGDFRFIIGFESFYDAHLESMLERNKYIDLEGYKDQDFLLDTLWNN